MKIKYNDIEFTVKEVNTPKFRKQSSFLMADFYGCVTKHSDNRFKCYAEFFYPEIPEVKDKDGNIIKESEIVPRFKEVFELFLEGDLSKINYELTSENSEELMRMGREILNFFCLKTRN